ncbi:hypothetical protein [Brucella sp. NBRC 12953]|uniref:hypothetical protein n=1 Tax=Brucella sp. NBRC 12953 TaxID=3075481 RepID=UPI003340A4FC
MVHAVGKATPEDWKGALELLSKIEKKDFSYQLESKALNIQKADPDVMRDPVLMGEINARLEEILVAQYKSPEGFRDA